MGNGNSAYPLVREIDLDLIAKALHDQATPREIFEAYSHLKSYSGTRTSQPELKIREQLLLKFTDQLISKDYLPGFEVKNCDEDGLATLVTPPEHLLAICERAMQTNKPRYAMILYVIVCDQMLRTPDQNALEKAVLGMKKAADEMEKAGELHWAYQANARIKKILKDTRQQMSFDKKFIGNIDRSLNDLDGVDFPKGYWKNLGDLMREYNEEHSTKNKGPGFQADR